MPPRVLYMAVVCVSFAVFESRNRKEKLLKTEEKEETELRNVNAWVHFSWSTPVHHALHHTYTAVCLCVWL